MRGFRVGVANPTTPFGQSVREWLEAKALPVIELKFFELDAINGSSLSEFGDEIIVTQQLDPDIFPHLDLLFISGENRDLVNRTAQEASSAGVLTMVHGALGLEAPLALRGSGGYEISDRLILVPSTSSVLVALVLRELKERFDVSYASATILLPTADLGALASKELHQQFVSILNFESPPTEILGEQLAFNALVAGSRCMAPSMVDIVEHEVRSLTAIKQFSASLVRVPVFHGYCASLCITLGKSLEIAELRQALQGDQISVTKQGANAVPPNPVSVSESEKIHVSISGNDKASQRTFFLWVVGDLGVYRPAHAAIKVAGKLLINSNT